MSWLAKIFRPHVELPPQLARRVHAWRARASVVENSPIDATRFVIVDVETSELDVRRGHLLAIGGMAVESMALKPSNGFAAILMQPEPTVHDTVLIHGIGPQMQASGVEREDALIAFLEFTGKDTLVAYHAGFDRTMLDRAAREVLGVRLLNHWIDLAQLAPALYPEAGLAQASLDDWLMYFHLRAFVRHRAVDDAMVTGELFLILLKRAQARGLATIGELITTAEAHQRTVQGSGFGGS